MRKWGKMKEQGGAGMGLVLLWHEMSEKYQSLKRRPLEHLDIPVTCNATSVFA
jgi:hypothetical protein